MEKDEPGIFFVTLTSPKSFTRVPAYCRSRNRSGIMRNKLSTGGSSQKSNPRLRPYQLHALSSELSRLAENISTPKKRFERRDNFFFFIGEIKNNNHNILIFCIIYKEEEEEEQQQQQQQQHQQQQ